MYWGKNTSFPADGGYGRALASRPNEGANEGGSPKFMNTPTSITFGSSNHVWTTDGTFGGNSIYGNSDTVTPESISCTLHIKY